MGTGIWGFLTTSEKPYSRVLPEHRGHFLAEVRTAEPAMGQPPTGCSCSPGDTSLSWGQHWGCSSLRVRWWGWHLPCWNRTRKTDDLRLKALRIIAQKRTEKTRLKIHADPNSLPLRKNFRQSVLQMCLTQAPAFSCSVTSLSITLFSGLHTCPPPRSGSFPSPEQAWLNSTSCLCLRSPLHLVHRSPLPGLSPVHPGLISSLLQGVF